MNTKIKHIGIISEQPAAAGKFYEALFGVSMEEIGSGRVSRFSDGYLGFNINSRTNGRPAGLNHWGFAVDSVGEIEQRLREKYPAVEVIKRPSNRPFAGYGSHDPEGNIFDLSPADMSRGGVYADQEDKPNPRHISHFTLPAMNARKLAEFYKDVYEFEELPKPSSDPRFYLSDGFVTMVVAPWKLSAFTGGLDGKPCIDHLGWRVESMARFFDDVERLTNERPEMAPKAFNGEVELRREVLAQCALGRYQLADFEGVLLDISDH